MHLKILRSHPYYCRKSGMELKLSRNVEAGGLGGVLECSLTPRTHRCYPGVAAPTIGLAPPTTSTGQSGRRYFLKTVSLFSKDSICVKHWESRLCDISLNYSKSLGLFRSYFLINADLQDGFLFAKFSEMGQLLKLQPPLPPNPDSLCPPGFPSPPASAHGGSLTTQPAHRNQLLTFLNSKSHQPRAFCN